LFCGIFTSAICHKTSYIYIRRIYKFRVTYENHEDIYRDIEIKATQSFMELHHAIQQAILFDNSKQAVFYTSDDYWRREGIIASVNSNDSGKK